MIEALTGVNIAGSVANLCHLVNVVRHPDEGLPVLAAVLVQPRDYLPSEDNSPHVGH